MQSNNADYTSTLNELIQTCIDGQNGFHTAAEAIDDPRLRSELEHYSEQRADFAQELQRLVASSGEEPQDSGSVAAAMHRGWINLKGAVSTRDTHSILAECERGEDSAVETYREAMKESLPPQLAASIASQYQVIQNTHDRVRDLRDAAKPN